MKDLAEHPDSDEIDASVYQRVSKAVMDAFVAVQIGLMVKELEMKLPMNGGEIKAVRRLYQLVRLISLIIYHY